MLLCGFLWIKAQEEANRKKKYKLLRKQTFLEMDWLLTKKPASLKPVLNLSRLIKGTQVL